MHKRTLPQFSHEQLSALELNKWHQVWTLEQAPEYLAHEALVIGRKAVALTDAESNREMVSSFAHSATTVSLMVGKQFMAASRMDGYQELREVVLQRRDGFNEAGRIPGNETGTIPSLEPPQHYKNIVAAADSLLKTADFMAARFALRAV
jgi:hypothetical protein